MPRWEHGSEDRLRKAAIELFEERGFEDTGITEIAERARVTTRTFFRYFSDKREVLFAGSEDMRAALIERALQAPDGASPLCMVIRVLAEFDWEGLAPREAQRRRAAVIAANPALLERELIKHHAIAAGFVDALRRCGVEAPDAALAARVGVQVFFTAYGDWLEAGDDADLAAIIDRVMSRLAAIASGADVPAAVTEPESL